MITLDAEDLDLDWEYDQEDEEGDLEWEYMYKPSLNHS